MAPQNPARMQQTRVDPGPPELVRQMNTLRAEVGESDKAKWELKAQLEAALRENEQLEKDKRVKNAGKGDDVVRKLNAECQKLRKEKEALVAENGKLKAGVTRSKKRLATEQGWSKLLSTRISQLEVKSQADTGKIQTLAGQLKFRNDQLKTKDSEIQTLKSKLKRMTEHQNRPLQTKKSRQEMEREISSQMRLETETEPKVLNTGHQPPLGQPKRSASNTGRINQGSAKQYQEQGEQQKPPTIGYGLKKADWIFWSTEDEYSGAEVVSQVEKLNSEMLQVAASMVDDLDLEHQMKGGQESENIAEATRRTAELIGHRLTSMLATSNSRYVDIVMQTALQTALLLHIQRIMSFWWPRDESEDRLLGNIYERLKESEPQPVSGRWRQLTRTHLRIINRIDEDILLPQLTESLANIVIATGYNFDQAAVKERFTRFSQHLGEIIKLALEVNTMIGEGITSCDLHITFVRRNAPYDATYMETVYSGTSPIPGHGEESVICTVDLGLMKTERVSKPEVHTKEIVLLKPKVLLPTVFEKI